MAKKYDVIALGELLIDFTMNGQSEQGNNMFEACPGGAPCNVLALLNKMGKKTAFIGKVGKDQFGALLRDTITEAGIDASNLMVDENVNTTLAFVHTFPDGDREFSFYSNQGAVETAKANGCLVSFDPNLRPPLWSSLDLAKEQMEYGFGKCDILKISDNEIQFVSGKEDYDEGIAYLQETYNIPLILLTMGKDGSRAYYKGMRVERPGFSVKAIETTGAGDTFCGSSLNYLVDHDFENLTEEQLGEMLTFANAAAALVTTKKGAIKAMPVKEEVLELIQK